MSFNLLNNNKMVGSINHFYINYENVFSNNKSLICFRINWYCSPLLGENFLNGVDGRAGGGFVSSFREINVSRLLVC